MMTAYLQGLDKNGNCCNDCNGIENCDCEPDDDDGEWIAICTFCNALTYSAGSSVTEYTLWTASTTCFGEWDYTVAGIYFEGVKPDGQVFFRNKNQTTHTMTGSSPAYLQQFQWQSKTKQTRTTNVLDENGNYIVCGGNSSVFYSDGAILEAISPYPSFAYSEAHEAYLPVSCDRRGARWYGSNGQFSWVNGHPSTGGWVNSLGTANFLSSSFTPSQTSCFTEVSTNEG